MWIGIANASQAAEKFIISSASFFNFHGATLRCPPSIQGLLDRLQRAPLRFHSNKNVRETRQREPAREVAKSRQQCRDGGLRRDDVRGAHDQRQTQRPDYFSESAKTVGGTHSGGSQRHGPHFGGIWTDDRKTSIGDGVVYDQQNPEHGYTSEKNAVAKRRRDNQYRRAKTGDCSGRFSANRV